MCEQFVTAARDRLEELLKATADRDVVQVHTRTRTRAHTHACTHGVKGIWLSNFVEAIVAQASGISRAASVLRDLSRCLSM